MICLCFMLGLNIILINLLYNLDTVLKFQMENHQETPRAIPKGALRVKELG